MDLQINIKNIRINSISTLGSFNVGKIMITENSATSAQYSKTDYTEEELDVNEVLKEVPDVPIVEEIVESTLGEEG
ncbi:hypothetical protein ACFYKX_05790 [Cytobacillus sp. FJAT-54145]|uniref:Spore germination protein n=1 Tax=Cytobacillus spartinae TaxID=3299023 RepID=A0ABW6K7G6_9BACI